MKKILTLLISAGAFVTLHAQSREQTRDIILGGNNGTYDRNRDVVMGGNNGQYPSYPNDRRYGNDRQYQIDQINRDYYAKIESIRNNRYLSRQERDRAIRQLEYDRQQRIDYITRQYSNYNDRYDDHDNGKHKGWYKGKGNPHRYDDRD